VKSLNRALAVLTVLVLAGAGLTLLRAQDTPVVGATTASAVPVWGPAKLPPPAVAASAGSRTGMVQLSSAGRERTAIVLTPRTSGRVPLVVVLHGRNTTPAQELVRTGFTDLAANGAAVLAYPAGIGRSWNARTGCCSIAAKQKVDDVAFLQALIPAIEKHAPVDPSKVYLVGYSNGGRLALTAACALPGIAGVATYGTAQPARCPTGRPPVPVLIGYGSADPHAAPGHVPDGATTGPVTAADWRSVEGCAPTPSTSTVGPATVKEWTSCRGAGRVALVRWDGLTHRWPGAGVVPAQATGRALMWNFLTGTKKTP
jgi:polyhydroxybutyrate depolymerase